MNPAFQFFATPAAGPRIRWISRDRSARLAADAQVSLVILREVVEAVFSGVCPHLSPGPIREQANLQQGLAAGQAVLFNFPKVLSSRRLLTPQTGEPNLERFERFHQRFDLSQLAALRGIFAIQDPELRFLLLDRFAGKYVYQIQFPFCCDAIAKLIGISEMVASLQKQNRNFRDTIF